MEQQALLGVQLWSVKNNLQRDFKGTVETLAAAGLRYVEAAGYDPVNRTIQGWPPKKIRAMLETAGLILVSAHAVFDIGIADHVLEDFTEAGVEYLIYPFLPGEKRGVAAQYYQAAELLNAIGRKAAAAGIRFGYHNHGVEFEQLEGETPYELLLRLTDPTYVFFEADLGWMVHAGHQPETYFNKYPGRFPLWHIRDVDQNGIAHIIGEGRVNFKAIFEHRKQAGYELGIIETPSAAEDGLAMMLPSFNTLKEQVL